MDVASAAPSERSIGATNGAASADGVRARAATAAQTPVVQALTSDPLKFLMLSPVCESEYGCVNL
jgi:hypothetical protein